MNPYQSTTKTQRRGHRGRQAPPLEPWASAIIGGFVGALLASVLFVVTGLSIEQSHTGGTESVVHNVVDGSLFVVGFAPIAVLYGCVAGAAYGTSMCRASRHKTRILLAVSAFLLMALMFYGITTLVESNADAVACNGSMSIVLVVGVLSLLARYLMMEGVAWPTTKELK